MVPGKSGLREESRALASGLSPKEEFPEVWPSLQPGFVALGMAGGRSQRLLVHLERGRVPAREPGWDVVKDVLWPSCVTREPIGDRQPGPLAHQAGLDTTIRSLDTVPSSPIPVARRTAPSSWLGRDTRHRGAELGARAP